MSIPQLRVLTYLCPTVPVELFQGILEVLEEQTNYQTTLQYEWRTDGCTENRLDPFENNLSDLAFMPAAGYMALVEKRNACIELLPVTPIFKHPKNEHNAAGNFVDVIVHADKLKHSVKQILDLRGCRWSCVRENTLANCVMLDALHKLGENITFFGSAHRVVSHSAAVNMVLTKQVDVATVDANALTANKRFLHNGAKDVVVLTSFGPFAPYAIVINTRINGDLKNKIIAALKKINGKQALFDKFGLIGFVPNHADFYDKEKQFMKTLKSEMSSVPYY
ncbi:hypothetical protein CBL_09063 [Carabus blaptoides fortunei]